MRISFGRLASALTVVTSLPLAFSPPTAQAALILSRQPELWVNSVTVTPNTTFDLAIHIDTGATAIAAYDIAIHNSGPQPVQVVDVLDGVPFRNPSSLARGVEPTQALVATMDRPGRNRRGAGIPATLTLTSGPSPGTSTIDFMLTADLPRLASRRSIDVTSQARFSGATVTVVPEPASLRLVGAPAVALLAWALAARPRRRSSPPPASP